MLLSDRDILKRVFVSTGERLQIAPVLDWRKQLQAASIDVRLGGDVILFRRELDSVLDVLDEEQSAGEINRRMARRFAIRPLQGFVVHPGDFLLATTFESLRLPSNIAARLEGKSSWGRLGLQVHSTAGFVDPGFAGKVTFEISNVGTLPIKLYAGILIAQLCFFETSSESVAQYGGTPGGNKYFGQLNTGVSKFYRDSELRTFSRHIKRLTRRATDED